MLNKKDISYVIPVFNLGDRIVSQLRRLDFLLTDIHYEIIIVNDGSTDNTLEFIRKEAESNRHIQIISYPQNKGKGYAIREGILKSVGEITVLLDGDTEISLDYLKYNIKEMQDWDFLIGSKRHPLSQVHIPTLRRILSKMFNILVRSTTGIKIKDTQVGLKIIEGSVCRRIFANLHIDRYAFDVELLFIASLLKLRVKEIPVNINIESQFKPMEIVRMFIDLVRIAYRYRVVRSYTDTLLSDHFPYVLREINSEHTCLPEIKKC